MKWLATATTMQPLATRQSQRPSPTSVCLRDNASTDKLFKHFLNIASDTSVLVPCCEIRFQTTAPLYLIPVLPRSDLTQGMWKCWALLVTLLWISNLFFTKIRIILELYIGCDDTYNCQLNIIDVFKFHDVKCFIQWSRTIPRFDMWNNVHHFVWENDKYQNHFRTSWYHLQIK